MSNDSYRPQQGPEGQAPQTAGTDPSQPGLFDFGRDDLRDLNAMTGTGISAPDGSHEALPQPAAEANAAAGNPQPVDHSHNNTAPQHADRLSQTTPAAQPAVVPKTPNQNPSTEERSRGLFSKHPTATKVIGSVVAVAAIGGGVGAAIAGTSHKSGGAEGAQTVAASGAPDSTAKQSREITSGATSVAVPSKTAVVPNSAAAHSNNSAQESGDTSSIAQQSTVPRPSDTASRSSLAANKAPTSNVTYPEQLPTLTDIKGPVALTAEQYNAGPEALAQAFATQLDAWINAGTSDENIDYLNSLDGNPYGPTPKTPEWAKGMDLGSVDISTLVKAYVGYQNSKFADTLLGKNWQSILGAKTLVTELNQATVRVLYFKMLTSLYYGPGSHSKPGMGQNGKPQYEDNLTLKGISTTVKSANNEQFALDLEFNSNAGHTAAADDTNQDGTKVADEHYPWNMVVSFNLEDGMVVLKGYNSTGLNSQ